MLIEAAELVAVDQVNLYEPMLARWPFIGPSPNARWINIL